MTEQQEKLTKLMQRKEKILESNQIYNENKDELLIFLEKFILLEKKLLNEKWWKLLEKEIDLRKYLSNLSEVKELIEDEEYMKHLTIS